VAIHSYIFGYPQNGTIGAIIAIMVPYIIGFTLLGVAISTRFRRSESAILTLVATSIPALLVSGASIPKQGFSKLLYSIGKLLPSSSAVESYYRVEAMGATAGEVLPQIATLWLLVIAYGTVAYIAIKIKASERTINPRTPL
jgi:ABC-2 type transport system permease protein